jgi:hypothetical protein
MEDYDIKDNKIMLLEEDLECVNMYLDDLKLPRTDDKGNEYSIVGRIKILQQEQDKNKYSEEEFLAFGKSSFYKGFEKAEKDDANCYTAFREEIGSLIEQFKNK